MFCHNCGSQLLDGVNFCSICGTKIGEAAIPMETNNVRQKTVNKNEACAELDRMIGYFSQKNDEYTKHDHLRKLIGSRRWRKRVGLVVWGAIFTVSGHTFLIMSGVESEPVLAIIGIILLLLGQGMIIGFIANSVRKTRKHNALRAELNELTEVLYQHYLGYDGECRISVKYTNPENLKAIRQTICAGRADTIEEAVYDVFGRQAIILPKIKHIN